MTHQVFKRVSGYGPAYEETALRIGVFTARDLRAAVDSVRPPSLDSARVWVRLQYQGGFLVKVREQSDRLPALYSVRDDVDYWGKPRSPRSQANYHAWRGGRTVGNGGGCGNGGTPPLKRYRLYTRPLNRGKLCHYCVKALLREQGVTVKNEEKSQEASEENANIKEEE